MTTDRGLHTCGMSVTSRIQRLFRRSDTASVTNSLFCCAHLWLGLIEGAALKE